MRMQTEVNAYADGGKSVEFAGNQGPCRGELQTKEDQAREGTKAWAEYEAQRRGVDEKIAKLKTLRLAKEAAEAASDGKK